MIAVLLIVLVLIFGAIGVYWYRFLNRALGDFKRKKLVLLLICAVVCVSCILNVMGVWSIAVLHITAISLVCDFIYFIKGKFSPRKYSKLYRFCVIPILCTALVFVFGYYNMLNIVRTEYTVTTDKSIQQDGYRVVLLADIHYGTSTHKNAMTELVRRVNKENADLIVLGGDIVDESTTSHELSEIAHILGNLESKRGTYYVYGNHDRATYAASPNFSDDDIKKSFAAEGIVILKDESVNISGNLFLIGREDAGGSRAQIKELTDDVPEDAYIIVADHQPLEFAEKQASGVGLNLSGHTHDGQIWPVGIIERIAKTADLVYGCKKFGNMTAITTSGVSGWGYTIRTQGHSEYTVIDIKGETK